jgi:hypothetical protein
MLQRFTLIPVFCAIVLSGCQRLPSVETSTSIEIAHLPPLLEAVQSLVEKKGLGDGQIRELENTFALMAVGETKKFNAKVLYRGRAVTLRIRLKKNAVDAVVIGFLTEPELATQIQKVTASILL